MNLRLRRSKWVQRAVNVTKSRFCFYSEQISGSLHSERPAVASHTWRTTPTLQTSWTHTFHWAGSSWPPSALLKRRSQPLMQTGGARRCEKHNVLHNRRKTLEGHLIHSPVIYGSPDSIRTPQTQFKGRLRRMAERIIVKVEGRLHPVRLQKTEEFRR